MISAYPKIFALGTGYIRDIFNGDVEITEKVDGSQFAFGNIDGTVYMRSKGVLLSSPSQEGMFFEAVTYVDTIAARLPLGIVFFGEYLRRPRHNVLSYSRVPKNNIVLFGAITTSQEVIQELDYYASLLDIDRVPVLYKGTVSSKESIEKLLDRESYLGGSKIEGIVVKNFSMHTVIGDIKLPLMAGKLVTERLKEVRVTRLSGKPHDLDSFIDSFRTDARWEKAVQHLRERGALTYTPRDIGSLIREVASDIEEEHSDDIKQYLLKEFLPKIKRASTKGLAEWYKQRLLEYLFSGDFR